MKLTNKANSIIKSRLTKQEKIISLCELVRDIPYENTGSHSLKDLVEKGRGSCTPKHIFLAKYLKKINVPVKFLITPFYYKKLKLAFPGSKGALLNEMPISYHTCLKARINRKWTIIDVTWDSKLKSFPINKNWNGQTNMKLAVTPESITEIKTDPRIFKRKQIKKYDQEEMRTIVKFYSFFGEFLLKSRK